MGCLVIFFSIFAVVSKRTLLVLRLAWPIRYASERGSSAPLSLLGSSAALIKELLPTRWEVLEPPLVFRQISARLSRASVGTGGLL